MYSCTSPSSPFAASHSIFSTNLRIFSHDSLPGMVGQCDPVVMTAFDLTEYKNYEILNSTAR